MISPHINLHKLAESLLFICMLMPVVHARAIDLPNTVSQIKPSIVGVGTVQSTRTPPNVFNGTGFVIADGRHVITNAHVIPESLDFTRHETLAIFVRKGDQVQGRRAKEKARDEEHDLCLLWIEGQPLPALKLGDSATVREGELYAFTGFPIGMALGLYPVTHRGIVSAITPIVIPTTSTRKLTAQLIERMRNPYKVFQLDATAYPGNSGSPLYELDTGLVVGVVNRVFVKESKENMLEKPSGISYAIPIHYARKLLKRVGVVLDIEKY